MQNPNWPKTPTLHRIEHVLGEWDAIGAFLDWAHNNGMELCEIATGKPFTVPLKTLLARCYDIDLAAAEREKQLLRNARP
jgi:hypothetical protein